MAAHESAAQDQPQVRTFGFHRSYYEVSQRMTDKQRYKFYDAIVAYSFADVSPDFSNDGFLDAIWTVVQPNLDASKAKSRAGSSGGGRPRKAKTTRRKKQTESQNEKTSFSDCISDDGKSDISYPSYVPSISNPIHSSSYENGSDWRGDEITFESEDYVF